MADEANDPERRTKRMDRARSGIEEGLSGLNRALLHAGAIGLRPAITIVENTYDTEPRIVCDVVAVDFGSEAPTRRQRQSPAVLAAENP